jgi:hypothetical protein
VRAKIFAVLVDFVLHAAAALLVASPIVAAVSATGISHFPWSDQDLFEPGGALLVEVVRILWKELAPLVRTSVVTALVLVVLLVLPYALVFAALARERPAKLSRLWGEASARFPALLALKGLSLCAQAAAVLATLTLAAFLRESFVGATSRRADLVALAVGAVGVTLVLGVGVLRDLASAAAVRHELNGRRALGAGLTALASAPGKAALGFIVPFVGGLALMTGAMPLVSVLNVGRRGDFRIAGVFCLHQAIVLVWLGCRAVWLGRALALVGPQPGVGSAARR